MPCLPIPAFPAPPPLPPGVSVPIFSIPSLPGAGLCCKTQVPPWGSFPPPAVTLPIAIPAAAVSAYAAINAAVQAAFDAAAIPCPNE